MDLHPGSSTTTSTARMVVSVMLHLSAARLRCVQRLDRSQPAPIRPIELERYILSFLYWLIFA
jgi:hypothetical protein